MQFRRRVGSQLDVFLLTQLLAANAILFNDSLTAGVVILGGAAWIAHIVWWSWWKQRRSPRKDEAHPNDAE